MSWIEIAGTCLGVITMSHFVMAWRLGRIAVALERIAKALAP